jgi:aromatic amino acid aminotransferase I / 2-aminoadipate transaminase
VAEAASVARPATFEKEDGASRIADVMARRAQAGKLVAGVAAYSDSDMFKGPVSLPNTPDAAHAHLC